MIPEYYMSSFVWRKLVKVDIFTYILTKKGGGDIN